MKASEKYGVLPTNDKIKAAYKFTLHWLGK